MAKINKNKFDTEVILVKKSDYTKKLNQKFCASSIVMYWNTAISTNLYTPLNCTAYDTVFQLEWKGDLAHLIRCNDL